MVFPTAQVIIRLISANEMYEPMLNTHALHWARESECQPDKIDKNINFDQIFVLGQGLKRSSVIVN